MTSSKPSDSTPVAIAVFVALGVVLLLVGGLVAFLQVRRTRAELDAAMAAEMHVRELGRQALARAADPHAGLAVDAEPAPAGDAPREHDPELQALLLVVLQERFAWRAGEPRRDAAQMAPIARQLSATIDRASHPARRERELRRECAWAFAAAGLTDEAVRELERALALLGPDDGVVRSEIGTELQLVRSARPR